MEKKTILSGVKPTGRPHIGNYFGAMHQFVELQNQNKGGQNFFMIADYHALNFIQNAKEMEELTFGVAADFLSIGLDQEKSAIFKQSDIPEHTELTWIFDTITTMPYLKRAHAYKDALTRGGEENISVGTFNYPMLMASDILLYSPDMVPVGQDQKQHIEFARDTAEKFNRIFGPAYHASHGGSGKDIFKIPEPYIISSVKTIPGTDGRKMSKSYGNTIGLFASDEEIEKAVMSIVTDSDGEVPKNVFDIHSLLRQKEELEKIYEENKGNYKALKEMLIKDLKNFIKPLREKREKIVSDREAVYKMLEEGKEKARATARAKMKEVKKAVGIAT